MVPLWESTSLIVSQTNQTKFGLAKARQSLIIIKGCYTSEVCWIYIFLVMLYGFIECLSHLTKFYLQQTSYWSSISLLRHFITPHFLCRSKIPYFFLIRIKNVCTLIGKWQWKSQYALSSRNLRTVSHYRSHYKIIFPKFYATFKLYRCMFDVIVYNWQ